MATMPSMIVCLQENGYHGNNASHDIVLTRKYKWLPWQQVCLQGNGYHGNNARHDSVECVYKEMVTMATMPGMIVCLQGNGYHGNNVRHDSVFTRKWLPWKQCQA